MIENAAVCDDITATINAARALGARVAVTGGLVTVTGTGGLPTGPVVFDALESGTTLRMALPVIAVSGDGGMITTRGSLTGRPLGSLADELSRRGAAIKTEDGRVIVSGRAMPGVYTVRADISSQYISGMLLAMAVYGGIELHTEGRRVSAPYIGMTKAALGAFGAIVDDDGENMTVSGRLTSPGHISVGGDWSAASVWLAAGHTVTGLDMDSLQGDSRIIDIVRSFSADVVMTDGGIRLDVRGMRGIKVDITDTPDLAPAVMLMAAQARGETRITGARRLRVKESDRAVTLTAALNAIGGSASEDDDTLIINGGVPLTGGNADACGDHRVAMMCAAAATIAREPVTINGAECTAKSWGSFADDIRAAGIRAEESI